MKFKKVREKQTFDFVDARCIGRQCWAPGFYQHRAPMAGGGSRNTGSPDTPCCLHRAYHGCPDGPEGERTEPCTNCDSETHLVMTAQAGAIHEDDLPEYEPCWICGGTGNMKVSGLPIYDAELAKKRKSEGWRAKS